MHQVGVSRDLKENHRIAIRKGFSFFKLSCYAFAEAQLRRRSTGTLRRVNGRQVSDVSTQDWLFPRHCTTDVRRFEPRVVVSASLGDRCPTFRHKTGCLRVTGRQMPDVSTQDRLSPRHWVIGTRRFESGCLRVTGRQVTEVSSSCLRVTGR